MDMKYFNIELFKIISDSAFTYGFALGIFIVSVLSLLGLGVYKAFSLINIYFNN